METLNGVALVIGYLVLIFLSIVAMMLLDDIIVGGRHHGGEPA